jgi:hypothetical protein
MRPKADSLGEKGPVHPSGLKGREKSLLDQLSFASAELLAALQAALMIFLPLPRASAYGRSPGLESPGPLGRFCWAL